MDHILPRISYTMEHKIHNVKNSDNEDGIHNIYKLTVRKIRV